MRLQADLTRQDGFFLAGGTGLALRLRHRFSDDLDWFTSSKFDAKELIAKMKALPRASSNMEQGGLYTVRAYYDRGTGPGLPLAHVLEADPRARVAIVPSDHYVACPSALDAAIDAAAAETSRVPLTLVGAEPTHAETEYVSTGVTGCYRL